MTYADALKALDQSPVVSYWLKGAADQLAKRDALDALRDAEQLLRLQKLRWEEMTGRWRQPATAATCAQSGIGRLRAGLSFSLQWQSAPGLKQMIGD